MLFVRLTVLDWRSFWTAVLMDERLQLSVFAHVGYCFGPRVPPVVRVVRMEDVSPAVLSGLYHASDAP